MFWLQLPIQANSGREGAEPRESSAAGSWDGIFWVGPGSADRVYLQASVAVAA